MAGPFKMKKFPGFGNSPMKQEKLVATKQKKLVAARLMTEKDFKENRASGFVKDGKLHAFKSGISFDDAFRSAKDAKVDHFYWRGGKKTTKLAK